METDKEALIPGEAMQVERLTYKVGGEGAVSVFSSFFFCL